MFTVMRVGAPLAAADTMTKSSLSPDARLSSAVSMVPVAPLVEQVRLADRMLAAEPSSRWRLIVLVPVLRETTFEDDKITSEPERLKAFGQKDHVRIYGGDVIDRLRSAGFTVTLRKAEELGEERVKTGALAGKTVYICSKTA